MITKTQDRTAQAQADARRPYAEMIQVLISALNEAATNLTQVAETLRRNGFPQTAAVCESDAEVARRPATGGRLTMIKLELTTEQLEVVAERVRAACPDIPDGSPSQRMLYDLDDYLQEKAGHKQEDTSHERDTLVRRHPR